MLTVILALVGAPEPVAHSEPLAVVAVAFFNQALTPSTVAALPVTGQRLMHRRLPCQAVYPLDASHSPFYSRPDELACTLQALLGHPAAG